MPITEAKRQYLREYRKKNKQHIKKVAKAKYDRNREEIRKRSYQKYHKNPKHFIEMAKKSIKKNYARVKKYNREKYWKNRDTELLSQCERETPPSLEVG